MKEKEYKAYLYITLNTINRQYEFFKIFKEIKNISNLSYGKNEYNELMENIRKINMKHFIELYNIDVIKIDKYRLYFKYKNKNELYIFVSPLLLYSIQDSFDNCIIDLNN